MFFELKLAGFGLEDPKATPVEWDIAFETTGDNWLGITVSFIGNSAQEPMKPNKRLQATRSKQRASS
jgi:hypothetical protein